MRNHAISEYVTPAEPKGKEQLFSAPGTAQQLSKGLFHIQHEQSAVCLIASALRSPGELT